ncbi:peptide deformylase [Polluticaenibacter yanchengensis]|uniref:Peptide deformylase n=1 Tax=Polluticaenibacter yanchengensis TaxID=3014562 RepID=A0ABT4UN53_9BACT|nr:peptide deformylase [Chitinophagaceae bacterium LY-5]
MKLPIVAFGSPILRKVAEEIDENYPDLKTFIQNMWDTMYGSYGVGLAAPQVNKSIRIFVVDSKQVVENFEDEEDKVKYANDPGIKQVFINPEIEAFIGEEEPYTEGCLSIPKIREDVKRPASVKVSYFDEDFNKHTEVLHGISARVFQHEFDHLDGKLFIDYLSPLKRKLMKGKLLDISNLKVRTDYRMIKAN